MDNSNLPRKRKNDSEADEVNEILRKALGTRPTSAPKQAARQRPHSDTSKGKKPAVKPVKPKPADLMRLRSVVDGRVNNWKSKQPPEAPSPGKRSKHIESSRTWASGSSSRSPHVAPETTPASSQSDGVFQRFVNEDTGSPSSRRSQQLRVKREHHGHGHSNSRSHKRRSTKSRSAMSVGVKREDSIGVQYGTPEQGAANESSELRAMTDGAIDSSDTRPVTIKQETNDSSDEEGIIGVVDTRRNGGRYG